MSSIFFFLVFVRKWHFGLVVFTKISWYSPAICFCRKKLSFRLPFLSFEIEIVSVRVVGNKSWWKNLRSFFMKIIRQKSLFDILSVWLYFLYEEGINFIFILYLTILGQITLVSIFTNFMDINYPSMNYIGHFNC